MTLWVIYAIGNGFDGYAYLHSAYRSETEASKVWKSLGDKEFSYYMEPIQLTEEK